MKTCKKCGIEQPLSNYQKHPETKDKLNGSCKDCNNALRRKYRDRTNNAVSKKYEKTKKGFLMRLYRNMQSRINGIQIQKYHLYAGKELLDRQIFYNWALNNQNFHSLFDAYEQNNFNRKLAPSVDRIDSSKGYFLENMEFVTHSENSRRGSINKSKKP